ncbi:DUF4124 domain-containing protein [Kingella potus]|uniref:DUF4124 domain-containing protein n=1 Tax=Kingella potus TaxID=265175 RepID=UPI001FCF7DC5|nr:DUF4124 domain-containing protein [Kingella potus]UOP01683.1 DUF4124 domain-containing protein [Kingella potus]
MGGFLVSGSLYAKEIYRWKDKGGYNKYSDVPRGLKPTQSTIINVRTHKVTPPADSTVQPSPVTTVGDPNATPSLADQQAAVNAKIAEENKAAEQRNKEIEEQNKQAAEANCKTAQMNLSYAQTAKTDKREALIQRFNQDVSKYCR